MMRHLRVVLLLVLVAALLAMVISWVKNELAFDRCMDRGGHWNAVRSVCEGTHSAAGSLAIIAAFQVFDPTPRG